MPLEQPLLPLKLLKNRNYVAVVASAAVGNIIYFSMNLLWPEMIADLYTTDIIQAGWLAVSGDHNYPEACIRLIHANLVYDWHRGGGR